MAMCCFSSRAVSVTAEKPSSKVVMLDGTLREFSKYTTANNVMDGESDDWIIFDVTDKLHVGEYILPLKRDDELYSGHTYMVLPRSMLHQRLDSVDVETLCVKVKEAVVMAAVEKKLDRRSSSSFCGLREMSYASSGQESGEKVASRREERRELGEDVKMISNSGEGEGKKKLVESKPSKCRYVWYLGFASFPIEEDR